jgi:hypothetical protein
MKLRIFPRKAGFFRQYDDFGSGVPSHGTLVRVVTVLSAQQLQIAFAGWMKACHNVTDETVVTIENKIPCGSYFRGKKKCAIRVVSAFSASKMGGCLAR